ncbi:MAG: CHAT domain-containing protein [Saprospiraceae bacterium]
MEDALTTIKISINHLGLSSDILSYGDSYYIYGNILSKLNRPAEAESAYTEARCLVFPELPTDRLPLIQEIPAARHYFAANLFMDYGHHLLRHEQPDDALEAYELSWSLLDSMRVDLKDDQSQRLIATKLEPTYAGALDALYQLYTRAGNDPALAERAFQLAERFRAAALLQALATRADRRSAEELDLRLRIADLERRTRETESDADLELSDELVRSRLKLEKLAAERPAAPQLPELDLPALQAYLAGRNETLLAYAFGRERGYVFRLDGNSLSWHPLGERKALADQITRLRESLTASAYAEVSLRDPAEQGRLDTAYTNAAHGLYATWLAPALAGTAPEHLLILPAGELGYLPFGALLTAPAAPPVDYSALPYLDRGRQVRYGYSARTLTQPPAAHDHAPEHDRVLALAPGFPAGGTESTLLRGLREGGRLMRLAYSRPEVVEIASLLPTDTFFDGAANRACFLDRAPNYRVLHLSSHALVDERATDFSFIAFNQETDSLNRDELLYVNDLYALPLRADLAVLSACETGLGEAVAGEGVVSLARAFAYAGVGATVTTLWGVNDRATQHLVVDFYRRLAAREDKPAALAAATEKARAGGEYMHPFYWSGLVLYGRPEAVNLGGNNGWYWWLGGGLLLLSAGGWWWQRR